MKQPICSVDDVVTSLLRMNSHEISRWNQPIGAVRLGALVPLTYDGRRVKRNHDLIDALKADDRVIVHNDTNVRFSEVLVSLSF